MKKIVFTVNQITLFSLLATLSVQTAHAYDGPLNLCVFDPSGTDGVAYGYAQDYILQAPRFGVLNPIMLKAYTDEARAAADFKTGHCDGVILTTIRAREFNHYTGSLDAFGALPTTFDLNLALKALSTPQLAPKMSQGEYEVLGIVPVGTAYIIVNDRQLTNLSKAAGKKIAVLNFDKSEAKLVKKLNAQPVMVDITTVGQKFNAHQIDIFASPAVTFRPMELWRGMTATDGTIKGAIIRFPVGQVTATLIAHKNKFPNEIINQKIREYVFSQIGTAYKFIDNAEKGIDPKYWINLSPTELPNDIKLLRDTRIELIKDGTYDKDMLHLLKNVRCKTAPTNPECTTNDE